MAKRIAEGWLSVARHLEGYLIVDYCHFGGIYIESAHSTWIVPGTLNL